MVHHSEPALDAVFGALSHPTRRAITERLSRGDASVTELAHPFELSLPGVSKHLRVLEDAGLIDHWKEGRTRWCRLRPAPLASADEWLAHYRVFWTGRFVGLREHLERGDG
jgi:DNA-binding transcriptional ArsR family regulator